MVDLHMITPVSRPPWRCHRQLCDEGRSPHGGPGDVAEGRGRRGILRGDRRERYPPPRNKLL